MLPKTIKKLSLPDILDLPRGWIVEEVKKCGKANCHCTHGIKHGPYKYLMWRERGKLRKRYLNQLEAVVYIESGKAKLGKKQPLNPHLMELGYYQHRGEFRASRKMKDLEREEKRYDLFKEAIQAQFGFPITKEEYLSICKAVISERKRCNRLGLSWDQGMIIEIS